MKGIKFNFVIDKLTLCYTTSEDNYNKISKIEREDYGDFLIERCKIEDNKFRDSFKIKIKEVSDIGIKYIDFAYLKLNLLIEKEGERKNNYIWVYIVNKCLYTHLYKDSNIIIYIEYIADVLNLNLNNITALDIALDTNINYAKRIKRAIFNTDLDVIVNGRLRDNEEVINEILYVHTANRIKYTNMTIYIKQASTDGFSLCIYDKQKEIIKSEKEYVAKWGNMGKNYFRCEIRLKNEHLKKYLSDIRCPIDIILLKLNEQEFLSNMFFHYANRLIRFRDSSKNIYPFSEI